MNHSKYEPGNARIRKRRECEAEGLIRDGFNANFHRRILLIALKTFA
jgi:hypothetical protein